MILFCSCNNKTKQNDSYILNNITTYPFYTSENRKKIILEGYIKIKTGMTQNEVLKILPNPDQIINLYEPKMYNPKQIGYTYWYIIQRLSENDHNKEKLVKISFDLNEKVLKIDYWGI